MGYRTFNYIQVSIDDEKTGELTRYDETGIFKTHIRIPFNEGVRRSIVNLNDRAGLVSNGFTMTPIS